MKFLCGPEEVVQDADPGSAKVLLFGRTAASGVASAGASTRQLVERRKLDPDPAAWDFLSIALSVVVADASTRRSMSPDGWTRQLQLDVATSDPDQWKELASPLSEALAFLTTDQWQLEFSPGARCPTPSGEVNYPVADAVALLSGGLDSLIGAIDLTAKGEGILAVSQTVRGDGDRQRRFAELIGGGLQHLQFNHNATSTGRTKEPSQRSRSIIFLAFAILAATATRRYRDGDTVPLYICENGFIAINSPLTGARVGSLSTRTAHPDFLGRIQSVLESLSLRIQIRNPYGHRTKGEMLRECLDQKLLAEEAFLSTSCGRFQRFNYQHCGRCVPCQIRRAAFIKWNVDDRTSYRYEDIGIMDEDHAAFDDVRSVAMALASVHQDGIDRWLGASLSSPRIEDSVALREMIQRGLAELQVLHSNYGVS